MGLAEVQAALARLFTDEGLRDRFFADPIAVGRSLGLDQAEAVGLSALSARHVEDFAATLRHKRVDDARKVLPLTARSLGGDFGRHLLAAIEGPTPPGRHVDDARALVARLAQTAGIAPVWMADLARYEFAFREAMAMRRGIALRRFRFPVDRIVASIYRGEPIEEYKPRPSLGIWSRLPGCRGLLHRVVPWI